MFDDLSRLIVEAKEEQDKIDKRNRLASMVPKIFVVPSIDRQEAGYPLGRISVKVDYQEADLS